MENTQTHTTAKTQHLLYSHATIAHMNDQITNNTRCDVDVSSKTVTANEHFHYFSSFLSGEPFSLVDNVVKLGVTSVHNIVCMPAKKTNEFSSTAHHHFIYRKYGIRNRRLLQLFRQSK